MSDISMSDDDRRRAVESRFSEMFLANFTNAFGEAIEKMTPQQVDSLLAKIESHRSRQSNGQSQTSPPPSSQQSAPSQPQRLSAFDKFVLGR